MSATLVVSKESNLSSKSINRMVLEVVDTAQVLGLPQKKALANFSGQRAKIRRLIELYNNFDAPFIPSPDQCWQ